MTQHFTRRSTAVAVVGLALVVVLTLLSKSSADAEAGSPRAAAAAQSPVLLTNFQRAKGITTDNHIHHPPGSILGSQTPELIPTEGAIEQLLRAVATLNANSDGGKLLSSYLSLMDQVDGPSLTEGDRSLLGDSALSYMSRTRLTPSAEGPATISKADFAAKRLELAALTWSQLESQLSENGRLALQQFIELRVKPNMTILRK
jgi:hypothetical protein